MVCLFLRWLSSSLRIGFVSGPHALIERLIYHIMVSSMHVSSLSQVTRCSD